MAVEDAEEDFILDTLWVIAPPEDRARVAGSAHQVTEADLERFEYNDISRVLTQVPGVYVRGEDGYGLRPNIGLRGVNSDRSSKVTLMEDGILLGPAPYAAPPAYFFPLTTRFTGVEVFKGPASIRFGPNTIGGAINVQTRPVPTQPTGYFDVAAGNDRFGKFHGYWGTGGETWGVLGEAVRLQTSGFKELDGGGDTGFAKNEVMLKGRLNTPRGQGLVHQLDIKLGYSDERSNETYLGLSRADFEATPYRRYLASANDEMDWTRTQVQVGYLLTGRETADLQVVAYRHDFDRAWTKLNRFRDGPEIKDILANPVGRSRVFYSILTGDEDTAAPEQALMIGTNHRTYVSEGVALVSHWRPTLGPVRQKFEFGARLHYDKIERDHTEDAYFMTRRTLVPEGTAEETTVRNRGSARSIALHLQDQVEWGDLLVVPGVRLELIDTWYRDFLARSRSSNADNVWLPGIGVHYQLVNWLGVLAGAHKGFSPVSPGQPDAVKPEESLNYEAGARLAWEDTRAELIGFYNNYSNLTGECTFSSGCGEDLLNRQFNGGAVHVYGAEAVASQEVDGPLGTRLRGELNYTLTLSEFQTSFVSESPQFGRVEEGDQLPYVPVHQGTAIASVRRLPWSVSLSASYVGEMRDIPGQGEIPESERIEEHWVLDTGADYNVTEHTRVYLTVNNLLNSAYPISYRPFGLRPGAPLQGMIGVKYTVF
jgi:Fe(3+) dicitrate transport protein